MPANDYSLYTIKFDPAQWRALERMADARDMHISVIIRDLVEDATGVSSSIKRAGRPRANKQNDPAPVR